MTSNVPLLELQSLSLHYLTESQRVIATDQVSFVVQKSDRCILLGPSGCGKSTLLTAVAGYMAPASGKILLNGQPVSGPGPDRIMVFQGFDQLLPWKTVLQNVLFAIRATTHCSSKEAEEIARTYLQKVKLSEYVHHYPHTLSGGMKQRVAIARALAVKPALLLMDEPFAALDALTRGQMQEELLQLWQDHRFTMLFVTHSIPEAIRLGSRIIVLSPRPARIRAEVLHLDVDKLSGESRLTLENNLYGCLFNGSSPGAGSTHVHQ